MRYLFGLFRARLRASIWLAALALAGCMEGKSTSAEVTDPLPDPSGPERLNTTAAFPGWYQVPVKPGTAALNGHTYYLFQGDGVYHLLRCGYRAGATGDSVLISIQWVRGSWWRGAFTGDTAVFSKDRLNLYSYQRSWPSDTAGMNSRWQSGAAFESFSGSYDYSIRYKYDTLILSSDLSPNSRLARMAGPPDFTFVPEAGAPIPGGNYDLDMDGTGDSEDDDIDDDNVANGADCAPFSRFEMVTTSSGGCTDLPVPTSLKAVSGAGRVSLTWYSSGGETFVLAYQASSPAAAPGGEVKAKGTEAAVEGLVNGVDYIFSVRSIYGNLASRASDTVHCTPLAPPKDLKVAAVRDTLKLSWSGEGSPYFRIAYWHGSDPADSANALVAEALRSPFALTAPLLTEGNYSFAVRGFAGRWATGLSAPVTGTFLSGMHDVSGPWSTAFSGATALALQDDSLPVLVYSDSSQQNTLAVSIRRDGAWSPLGAPGIRKPARNCVLRIAPDGSPYVLFRNDLLGKLDLVRMRGGGWESAGLQEFLDNADWGNARIDAGDLAIGKDGALYVAFSDPGRLQHLTVLRRDSAGWTALERRGFSAGAVTGAKLAMGSDGAPRVVYIDPENEATIVVKALAGGHWESVGITQTKAKGSLSIALDGQDRPLVACTQGDFFSGTAAVIRFDGAAWKPLGALPIPAASEAVLALGPGDTPYLALDTHYLYRFDGGVWEPVGPERVQNAGAVSHFSLAVSKSGIVYLSHTTKDGKGSHVAVRTFEY